MSEERFPDVIAALESTLDVGSDTPDALRRKLIEQKILSEQLGLIGSAVRVSAQGIAILTPAVETEGPRIAFVNDGFCALYGRTADEVIGQTSVAFGIIERHEAILSDLLDHVFERQMFEG